ncbi:MAG: helix-turn-helix domain-containing protein [Phaeodactylibacter sp.]|uniref:helix-turn-helix domain-containing protein n=1 Tax=Phaeodactylibacter sp. TaxID=1940289 RepID=UPI0032EFD419
MQEYKRLYKGREAAAYKSRDKNMVLIVRRLERTVRDYAELLLLTPHYLNAVWNKVAGKSAGELIWERVTLEARRMLLHDARTIAEIGYYLSFLNNSCFSRFFKKHEGISPGPLGKYTITQNTKSVLGLLSSSRKLTVFWLDEARKPEFSLS